MISIRCDYRFCLVLRLVGLIVDLFPYSWLTLSSNVQDEFYKQVGSIIYSHG